MYITVHVPLIAEFVYVAASEIHSFSWEEDFVQVFVCLFVCLFVCPCPDELLSNRLRPNPHWKQKMTDYIATVPGYYAQVSWPHAPNNNAKSVGIPILIVWIFY